MPKPLIVQTGATAERTPASAARRLALAYAAAGSLWILASDFILDAVAFSRLEDVIGDVFKGLLFIIVTMLVLWRLFQKELERREQVSQEALLYKQLTEAAHDATFIVDPADRFRIVYVNEAAVKHFGYPREHLLTLHVYDWSPTSTMEMAEKMWARIQQEKSVFFESSHRLADGREVPVDISAYKIRFQGKEYLAGSWRNVLERKQAEAALREAKERHELALRGAGLGTWDWHIQTGKVIFNRRWAEMLGYRVEELEPDLKTWEKLVHPDDLPGVMKKLEDHLAGKTGLYTAELRLKTKAGEWLWVLDAGCVFGRDAEGKPLRAVGIHLDIDAQKRAEGQLRDSETRLRLAVRAAGLGIWDRNLITNQIYWDERMLEIYGLARETFLGRVESWENSVHPEDLPRIKAAFQKALADQTDYEAEYRIIHANGTIRHTRAMAHILRDTDGRPVRALGTVMDVTTQREGHQLMAETQMVGHLGGWEFLVAEQQVTWTEETYRIHDLPVGVPVRLDEALNYYPPAARAELTRAFEVLVQTGTAYDLELPFVSSLGRKLWVRTTGRAEMAAGQVRRLFGILQDITSLKNAQEQLRSERDFSKWTMDVLPGVFYVLEADGRIRSWNPQLERVTGRKAEQLLNVNCLEMLHPADHAITVASIQKVFRTGEDQVDARVMALDGSTHPHHFHGRRIELEGHPCILGIGIDIAEREKMEAELANQLHFQQTLMNAIPVPIFIKDRAGRFLDCNRACEEFLALRREDMRGKTVADITPPELAKIYLQKDEEIFARGGTQIYESKVRNAAGELRDAIFHKATFAGPDGTLQGAVGAILDVTELKRAQGHLLLQESALNAAANGIVITDHAGKILWANPAFTTLTGYAAEEVTGLTPQVLKSGRQDSAFYQGMWQTILDGKVWRGEVVNKRRDGSLYDEEMTITPVQEAAGKITHFIAIKQDITQRKLMEAQYLRAQRMEGIGLLAGGIAHDLNNVLAPIMMSIQLLEDLHPDEETRDILHTLQNSAQRGADVVHQVLTFARGIKGARLLLAPRPLIKDMGRVAQEAFPKNIRVSTDAAPDLWNVTGDPTQLHQVLLNLSINARDAMPAGGTLLIAAHNETVHDLRSELGSQIADGDYVVLAVKDTGPGIPPELHERIFEPFFTTKEQGKGTGLGLSTVMGIVKSHHGYLRVVSEPGKGAEFLVYLPAVKSIVTAGEAKKQTSPPQGQGELILAVDDEPAIVEMVKDILLRCGYRVLTASDGTEALALIAQNPNKVHLVLTDIMMPFMDGVALVRSLKKLAPEVKIIACSGLASGASMISKVDELRRLGVSPIMHKPFTANRLLNNVHRALNNEPLEMEEQSPDGTRV